MCVCVCALTRPYVCILHIAQLLHLQGKCLFQNFYALQSNILTLNILNPCVYRLIKTVLKHYVMQYLKVIYMHHIQAKVTTTEIT